MINKVTFTGRETMLTKGLESATKHAYVKASKIFSPAEVKAAEETVAKAKKGDSYLRFLDSVNSESTYTSPFAPTETAAQKSHSIVESINDLTQSQKNSFSWQVAHGTPRSEALNSSLQHIDFNA